MRFLLPFCLQEPFLFLLPCKFVPALRCDDAELVLTGLPAIEDELSFQKVGAEQDEGVGGTWRTFFFQTCTERIVAKERRMLGVCREGSVRLIVDPGAIGQA